MTKPRCDIAIIGAGLSGGLIALALARRRPDLSLQLVEASDKIGGNQRWSWFDSDLDEAGRTLLALIDTITWNEGYDVAFPGYARTLATPYRSIHSRHLAAALTRELAPESISIGTAVHQLDAGGVLLADGRQIAARTVIDCRGLAGSTHLQGGWQVFMGRHLRLSTPHRLRRPTIMDASIEQISGYRFVYVLPLGPNDLFVEDTYYQDTPKLDRPALDARIEAYCAAHGWRGVMVAEETGVLPVITSGDFTAFQAQHRIPGAGVAGVRGGFVHPLTSYSLPFAAGVALQVAANAELGGEHLGTLLERIAREHWRATRFYRLLGTMLFGAAQTGERVRIFERFYRMPQSLIERFYAARSTPFDRARILVGKPPVALHRALAALSQPRPDLTVPRMNENAQ